MPCVEQKRLQTSLILRCHSKVIKNIRKNNRCQSWWQREKFDFYTHLRLNSNFSHVKLTHIFWHIKWNLTESTQPICPSCKPWANLSLIIFKIRSVLIFYRNYPICIMSLEWFFYCSVISLWNWFFLSRLIIKAAYLKKSCILF